MKDLEADGLFLDQWQSRLRCMDGTTCVHQSQLAIEALQSIRQLAEDRPWPDPVVLGKIAVIAKEALEK